MRESSVRSPSMSSMETIRNLRGDTNDHPVAIPRNTGRGRANSIQRKRRSLNLVFGSSIGERISSPPAPDATSSPISDVDRSPSMLMYNSSYRHGRNRSSISDKRLSNGLELSSTISSNSSWPSRPSSPSMTEDIDDFQYHRRQSSSVNSSKRSSLHVSSEQDRLLQEKLQQLARNENAKLIDNSIEDLNIPSSSPIDSNTPAVSGRKQIQRSRGSSLLSNSPRPKKRQKARSAQSSSNIFVISDDDIQKLDDPISSMNAIPGPTRPGNIGGTILSWKMTSDIVRVFGKSVLSPDLFLDLTRFVWSTFTKPENFTDVSFRDGVQLLPPKYLVSTIKESLPKMSDAFFRLKYVLKSIGYTAFSFSVILIQVTLIGIMLIAYVIGDIISAPARWGQNWLQPKTASTHRITKRKQMKQMKKNKRH
jgi:hypothetical protein